MKKFIRKIRRVSSHSYSINIPKSLMKLWGWRERQKLVLAQKPKKKELTIKDWPQARSKRKKK